MGYLPTKGLQGATHLDLQRGKGWAAPVIISIRKSVNIIWNDNIICQHYRLLPFRKDCLNTLFQKDKFIRLYITTLMKDYNTV